MKAPFFLVAMPQMKDPFFTRKVIMVVEHDDKGSFGFILNSLTAHDAMGAVDSLAQIKVELKDMSGETVFEIDEPLYWGGPVQDDTLWLMHQEAEFGDDETIVDDGIYLSSDIDIVQKVLEKRGPHSHRFYLGASSWGAGQLESEIRSGAWLIVPFDRKFLFQNRGESSIEQDALWKDVSRFGGCDPFILVSSASADMLN